MINAIHPIINRKHVVVYLSDPLLSTMFDVSHQTQSYQEAISQQSLDVSGGNGTISDARFWFQTFCDPAGDIWPDGLTPSQTGVANIRKTADMILYRRQDDS